MSQCYQEQHCCIERGREFIRRVFRGFPIFFFFSIEDAIRLCWEFEEQYLWVDSLCIIQDDPEDKAKQIGMTEEIYSASVLILVVVGGEDVESGSFTGHET
jgi:hypothetical protein